MNAGPDLGTRERECFPQVEGLTQFLDGLVPRRDCGSGARMLQPVGQRFLARPRPGQRQQLEQ